MKQYRLGNGRQVYSKFTLLSFIGQMLWLILSSFVSVKYFLIEHVEFR